MGFIGKYYVQGDALHECSEQVYEIIHQASNVYEVIRMIDGIPLFLEQHLERLKNSAKFIELDFKTDNLSGYEKVNKLAQANRILNGNIKVVLKHPGNPEDFFLFFIPHSYPSAEDYLKGVEILTFSAERSQPNAKISNLNLRARADKLITRNKVAEVLLVNQYGFITEGSRSNIFFIRGNKIHTPPLEFVLPGITRKMIFDICSANGIVLHESKIKLSDLGDYLSVFLTGTSPKVLPVRKIDDVKFEIENPLLREIMEKYDQVLTDYLSGFRPG